MDGSTVDGSDQSTVTAEYSALVRGPSAIFPRGGIGVFSIWYAGFYLYLLWVAGPALWYNLVALVALGAAAATVTIVFSKAKSPAFGADSGGIRLGKKVARPVRLEWEHIRQLKISSDKHGSVLQILLDTSARPTGRVRQLASLALFAFVPMGFRRARPGLLTVLPDPPRYQVPLAQVTPEKLRSALSALAPPAIPIEMRL